MNKFNIAEDMLKILSTDHDDVERMQKLASALESLNYAAELLENLDQSKYSELVNKIIENSSESLK